jgi:hypothetical protein
MDYKEIEKPELELNEDVQSESSESAKQNTEESPIELLENQLAEAKDKHLRLFAEFDNFKKRNAKEKLEYMSMAGKDVLLEMISVKDDFERAMKSFENSEAPHRDTHDQLSFNLDKTRVMASISKTVHGAPNHFEINVIGTKKYVAWKFLEQDLIETSVGANRTFITRNTTDTGSCHWPHHSLGWLEGYVEIIRQYLKNGNYPTLKQNLDMLEFMIS